MIREPWCPTEPHNDPESSGEPPKPHEIPKEPRGTMVALDNAGQLWRALQNPGGPQSSPR
eukprot:613261-Alexandrium_andersonii.AAC.1